MKRFFDFLPATLDYFHQVDERFNNPPQADSMPGNVPEKHARIEGIKAVVWDIYGTMCGSQVGDLEDSVNSAAKALGATKATLSEFRLHDDFTGQLAGKLLEELLLETYSQRIIESHQHSKDQGIEFPEVYINRIWDDLLRKYFGKNDADLTSKQIGYQVGYFYDHALQAMSLYPGIAECLISVKQAKLEQGIISNAQFYTPLRLRRLLRLSLTNPNMELDELFDDSVVFFSFEMGFSKPNPLTFDKCLHALKSKNIKTHEVVFIGNDMRNDMMAASRAGCKTILFAGDISQVKMRQEHPDCSNIKPDAIVHSALTILKCLGIPHATNTQ